jgi:hypothetical protein
VRNRWAVGLGVTASFALGLVSGIFVGRDLLDQDEPTIVFCEVSDGSSSARHLAAGSFVDGSDSGCSPDERRVCAERRAYEVLQLVEC